MSRDPAGVVSSEAAAETEGSQVGATGEGANLSAPDNARLLGMISALETRLNQMGKRVGMQTAAPATGAAAPAAAAAADASAAVQPPITGLGAIPQTHNTQSLVVGATDYPPSSLVVAPPTATSTSTPPAQLAEVLFHTGTD